MEIKSNKNNSKISIESGFNSDSTKQEIITHVQNLVDVCYNSKKLSHNDLYEVQELIKKLETERAEKGTI